jgi:hypothetical protein
MKKYLFSLGLMAMLAAPNVSADFISGDMTLRDAIYLYGQGLDAKGSKVLVGHNCDVFQLVLDVTTGFTDLGMAQGNNATELNASYFAYPDRIYDYADMFAYSLYANKSEKAFVFGDKNNSQSSTQIGTATVFGYCYSTKADAYVYFEEDDKCTLKYSDGSTSSISNCTPSSTTPPAVDLSSLAGNDSSVLADYTVSGPGCAGQGITTGSYTDFAQASGSVNGSQLTLNLWGGGSYYTFILNYQSGDATSGFNLSGTFQEVTSGSSGTATALSIRNKLPPSSYPSANYNGFLTATVSNCTIAASIN